MRHRILDTFTGPFALIELDDGRLATSWLNAQTQLLLADSREDERLEGLLYRRLGKYFDGCEVDFQDVPTPDGADFFKACWKACRRIARGRTVSYGELAALAGSTAAAARAAGQAMRRNHLPIIIPCHRVIGSRGDLHGFGGSRSGSGPELAVKSALLRMEGAAGDQVPSARRIKSRRKRVLSNV